MSVKKMPIPNYLRQMELKVESGVDADSIPGIERLWLWRSKMQADEWAEEERKFLAWLRKRGRL